MGSAVSELKVATGMPASTALLMKGTMPESPATVAMASYFLTMADSTAWPKTSLVCWSPGTIHSTVTP